VWYILIPAGEDVAKSLPAAAIGVDISDVSLCEAAKEPAPAPATVSALRLTDIGRRMKENNYIPEEYWKKIDALEEYIAARSDFELDNVTIRRIEAEAGILLGTGADIYTAVDTVMAGRVLPALANCPRESITGEEDGIITLIDRIFGLDNLPLCHEYFRKLGVA
jgi:hypothetical protein